MIRMAPLVTAFVLILAPLAPIAQAQVCINWVDYCDGLELTIEGNWITGFLRNADCDGLDVPVVGVIHDGIDNPCGPEVGRVGIVCEDRFGCEIFGDEWYWILNKEEGNWDLGHSEGGGLDPPGACWLNDIEYEVLLGPCSFFGPSDGKSMLSTVQARR